MKSYAVSIDEFIRLAKMADQFGADVITIVDSAGGMFPVDIKEYVLRLKDATDKEIGFHGHNNLQLAIANTLEAVKAGASVVDSSLQGMGRSAGNAQTEVLVTVLEKLGYSTGVDPYKVMDLGERVIKPMMHREQGVDDMSLVSGIAQFHSSFSKIIYDAARKYQVDPRMLIVEVSETDRVNVSRELAESTAMRIKENMQKETSPNVDIVVNTGVVRGKESINAVGQARLIADEMVSQSKKTGKESVFSITVSKTGRTSFPFVRQSSSFVVGNVEASDLGEATSIIKSLDGKVDWLLLDESCSQMRESRLERHIRKSIFTWYSEERVLRLSVCTLLSQRRHEGMVMVLSDKENADLIKLSLKQQGIPVITAREIKAPGNLKDMLNQIGATVSFGVEYAKDLTEEYVPLLLEHTAIYAARPNAFLKSFWDAALAKGLSVCRVDIRAALAAEIGLVIETKKTIGFMGSTMLSGISLVAGGVIGQRGSVVVDSVTNPTRVIGIADGIGGLLSSEEEAPYLDAKEKIKEELIKNLYKKEF